MLHRDLSLGHSSLSFTLIGYRCYYYRYVDDYRLCCEFISSLRSFNINQCQTIELQPPLSLCGSLMQNNFLRVSMWILGLSALIGNAVVIIKRSMDTEDHAKSGNHSKKVIHSIMVLNLAISDFMMGVYMLIIAGADLHFGEKYSQVASYFTQSCRPPFLGHL